MNFNEHQMRSVSLDNGDTFDNADGISDEDLDRHWDALVELMEDDAREEVHFTFEPCSRRVFLERYLEIAESDLILG